MDAKDRDVNGEQWILTTSSLAYEVRYGIDAVINRDAGLGQGAMRRGPSIYGPSVWWKSFLVANRLCEQVVKFVEPVDARDVGHRLKTKWLDVMHQRPVRGEHDRLGSLREGYRHWQAMFQSPWRTLDDLLDHVEKTRNAKEYVLIAPGEKRAEIHAALPMGLAEVSAMLLWAVTNRSRWEESTDTLGVRWDHTTHGRLRSTIGDVFERHAGANLNLDLLNEKCREHGYLRLWSLVFNRTRRFLLEEIVRGRRPLRSRDGRPDAVVEEPLGSKYRYAQSAKDVLLGLFDQDGGLAEAHVDVANELVNVPDWRLRFFIKASEHCPLEMVDGALTASGGDVYQRMGRPLWLG